MRDLGGLRTGDGRVTRHGVLVRSSMIGSLTPTGSAAVRAYGVRTVIDLRWASETDALPSVYAPGTTYRNVPVDSERQLALVDQVGDDQMARQLALLERPENGIRDAIEAIADAEPAIVVHCSAGRDRTGIVVALTLAALGVVDDDVADDYCASDEALAVEYERFAAGDETAAAQIAAAVLRRRTLMHDVLRCVRAEYGDARRYLARLGVRPAALERLRALLLTDA